MRHYTATLATCFLTLSMLCPALAWAASAPVATPLLVSGAKGAKKNLVIIGDGYTAGEQAAFESFVDTAVINGLFAEGPLREDMNAFNITRINVASPDHGVSKTAWATPAPVALVPDNAPDGSRVNFTFTGNNTVKPIPFIHGVKIADSAGRNIWDSGNAGDNPGYLWDRWPNPIVTGTIDYNTGEVALNYSAGNAPPSGGQFTVMVAQVTLQLNTALDYRYSGQWNRCYFDEGPNTEAILSNILGALVPEWNYLIIVLNEIVGGGGCGGGGRLTVTQLEQWSTVAHESGHMIGELCDEYQGAGAYTGDEPGCVNMTKNIDRSTLKWGAFVNPATPLPTTFNSSTMDSAETAGAFEGGLYCTTGVYRPVDNGRMSSNSPAFGPVDYNQMKEVIDPYHDHDFSQTVVGDFDGDKRADLVIHNANSLELYLSNGTHQEVKWVQTMPLGNWYSFAEHDKFLVADFDGNGRDDLFVYNMEDWAIPYFALLRSVDPSTDPTKPVFGFTAVVRYDGDLPGWDKIKAGDQFYVADFDGDGKSDLVVANTNRIDWPVGYLGMLRSTGTGLQMVRRYDEMLPGWDKIMGHDRFFVANVNGPGPQDLYVSNVGDWSMGYLMPLLSTGTELVRGTRYDKVVPGWADLLAGDEFFVADFDGDKRDDLYAFNGTDWPVPYLGVLRSTTGDTLTVPVLHQGTVDGWDPLRWDDRFYVANIDGQGGKDLYAFAPVDLRLGRLLAQSDGLHGSWQQGQIGKWYLDSPDVFHVANFDGQPSGATPLDDLIVHNDAAGSELLGLLHNDGSSSSASVVYFKWIHHYLYQASGYW